MQRANNLLFNIALFLNCLLVFLLIFEGRFHPPVWLQVAGRTHPLLLHFPIVLIVLYALGILFLPRERKDAEGFRLLADLMLILAAFTAAITALMGLFLSRESGYDVAALQWHKWSGVGISVLTLAWYYFRRAISSSRVLGFSSALIAMAIIIFTGHQGAGITHGQNFLLAPMMPEQLKNKPVDPDEAHVFADLVKPIFEEKCMSCHNSKKAKGELILETEALIRKGGKSGALWDTLSASHGLLLERIFMPLEAKKHMPPQGKSQLTGEEINILSMWIRRGAEFNQRVADLPVADSLRQISQAMFTQSEAAEYEFDPAEPSTIAKLNTVNRVVTEDALNSPALSVSFFNSQLFKPEQLKELKPVKKQIVSVDLARMPVTDADVKEISEFENLRKLNLNFSAITGKGLVELKNLKFLRNLSVSGTKISRDDLMQLAGMPKLKVVFAWNTSISDGDVAQLKKSMAGVRMETGFKADTIILKLSPPELQNEEVIFTEPLAVNLKQYINGATIRYTLDGSEPDSLQSPAYDGKLVVDDNVKIKARTYKAGWITSDLFETYLYRSTFTPDSIIFLTAPEPSYKGSPKTLIDRVKGSSNFRNGEWMAWRNTNMEALLQFGHPVEVKNVVLSGMMEIGAYIMPPASIEIWGGDEPSKLKLLGRIKPEQPTKMIPGAMKGFECKFAPTTVSYIKVVAIQLVKLPSWHPAKGDKPWLFLDEIMVN